MGPRAKRNKTGIQHARAGRQRTSWESPFVAAWGAHWRSHRDQSTSLAAWMQQWEAFRSKLSIAWQLPWLDLQPADGNLEGLWVTQRLPTSIADVPHVCLNPRSMKWGSTTGRLWIQTDNQQVEQVLAGYSHMSTDHLRPLFVRISRSLMQLLESRSPRLGTSHFIEWDPRRYNSLADHAANVALDLQQDWARSDLEAIGNAKRAKYNLRLSVDGAKRGDGSSAGGLAIAAFLESGEEILLCRAGCMLGTLQSAFEAELLALEWGMTFFTNLIYSSIKVLHAFNI